LMITPRFEAETGVRHTSCLAKVLVVHSFRNNEFR
jgi:hypothetical protein